MHFPPAPEPLNESGTAGFVNYTIGSNFKTSHPGVALLIETFDSAVVGLTTH